MNGVNKIEFSPQQFGPKNSFTSLEKKSPAPNSVGLLGEETNEYNLKLSDKDKDSLFKEIEKLNDSLKATGTKMHYKYIDEADKFVVELVDLRSQEVIETLPPEHMIDLSIKLKEIIGLFIDKKV